MLIKGGHAEGDPVDHLFGADGTVAEFAAARSDNRHTHGTGCTLASALASRLGLGDDVVSAVGAAKTYVTGAIGRRLPARRRHRPDRSPLATPPHL